MNQPINRAQFLRGDLSGKQVPIRPPWALPEARFAELCSGCGECLDACPDGIIVAGRGKLPQVNFKLGECDFCGECVEACRIGALDREQSEPWDIRAEIQGNCLSLNAIVCRSCGDACEPRAIGFRIEPGGVSRPELTTESCTGCGACLAVCPVDAVHLCSSKKCAEAA